MSLGRGRGLRCWKFSVRVVREVWIKEIYRFGVWEGKALYVDLLVWRSFEDCIRHNVT